MQVSSALYRLPVQILFPVLTLYSLYQFLQYIIDDLVSCGCFGLPCFPVADRNSGIVRKGFTGQLRAGFYTDSDKPFRIRLHVKAPAHVIAFHNAVYPAVVRSVHKGHTSGKNIIDLYAADCIAVIFIGDLVGHNIPHSHVLTVYIPAIRIQYIFCRHIISGMFVFFITVLRFRADVGLIHIHISLVFNRLSGCGIQDFHLH